MTIVAVALAAWDLAASLMPRLPGHCGCGRHARPWFNPLHSNRWLWGSYTAALVIGGCLHAIDGGAVMGFFSAPLWLGLGFFQGYGLWLHEKDSRRRIAAKAKVLVRVNGHGRPAVTDR